MRSPDSSQAGRRLLGESAVPPVQLPIVEPAQEALCGGQGIDRKGGGEGQYVGARFVKHPEEGAQPLDMRDGLSGQTKVQLEEPEHAAGAETECLS